MLKKMIFSMALVSASSLVISGCGSSTDSKEIVETVINKDKVETKNVNELFKIVQGVYQQDNSVLHFNDKGVLSVYTYDSANSCLNRVEDGETSYSLDGKTLIHNLETKTFSIIDANQNEYKIHYDNGIITNFSTMNGSISGGNSININGAMLTKTKSTQFSENNILSSMCSAKSSSKPSETLRSVKSISIKNTDSTSPKINNLSVVGSSIPENGRAIIGGDFKINVELENGLRDSEIMYLFFNKNSAENLSDIDYYISLSNTINDVEVSCNRVDLNYNCSIDGNSAILENKIFDDAYLNLFVCEDSNISYTSCHYTDVLVQIKE